MHSDSNRKSRAKGCLVACLLFFNPAVYLGLWAVSGIQSAQMWMARHCQAGEGGLQQSESVARTWYQKAAENGHSDARYMMGATARRRKTARKWFLLAAQQGHVGAMVQMARLGRSVEERQRCNARSTRIIPKQSS